MNDVTLDRLTATAVAMTGADRADAEVMVHEAIARLGVNMPAGAVAVTDSVAEAIANHLAGTFDPSDAVPLLTDRVDPEDAEDLSPAAIRDYCRRAAHDMGIRNRQAGLAELPKIADEVATRIKREAAQAEQQRQQQDKGIRSAWNGAGTAVGSVWPAGSTYGVQISAKDPLDGRPESATAFFSREELEYFRDQITATLAAGN